MEQVDKRINKLLGINLGVNKSNELTRLVYEISRKNEISIKEILKELGRKLKEENVGKGRLFSFSKEYLLSRRFPEIEKKGVDYKPYFDKLEIPNKKKRCEYKEELKPNRVLVADKAQDYEMTEEILDRIPSDTNIEYIASLNEYRKSHSFDPYKLRKREIFITAKDYGLYKPCPCTKLHVGCGYYIMNLAFGCPMDCSYCYLQEYSNFPGIIINVNLEDYFQRFNELYKDNSLFRLGTGEFTDSLVFDEYTHYSKKLVNFFRDKDVLFEFKTKTDNINLLLEQKSSRNIIIAWSLNPSKIIKKEELYTVPLKQRLTAAKKCQEAGYKVAFHFDPIIYYEGWQKDYREVVENLFDIIKETPAWISLGTLRFNPDLKSVIEHRFPKNDFIYGELIVGEDRKVRYPKFIRKMIYKKMIKWIRKHEREVGIYLCMESSDVWEEVIMPVDSGVENYVIYQALSTG